MPRLDKLFERGVENGVKDLKMVGPEGIKDIEPNCVVRHCPFLLLSMISLFLWWMETIVLANFNCGRQDFQE